jgi:hypothetical protein
MRNGAGPWMRLRAEQFEFFDSPARLFAMTSSRTGLPLQALHVYADASASMRVRVASLFEVVNARGPEMDRSETVTLFNDMCLLAPASLLRADVTWRATGDQRVMGTFINGGNRVEAELWFDGHGELVNFVSHDRLQSTDGKTFRSLSWSTPVRTRRDFDGYRLPAVAEVVWNAPEGDFVYGRFVLETIEYNVGAEGTRPSRLERALPARA